MRSDLQYHPLVSFLYFFLVIGCTMCLIHPVCLGISLVSAVIYTLYLFGFYKAKKGLAVLLVLMLLTAVMNPAFSHQGVTVLTYLPTGNVLTLESILYGISAACMLAATILWFRVASEILTSDKIVYLFGKGFPVLGLILSMILGFIPKMQRKLKEIRMAGGERYQSKRKWNKLRCGIEDISILITWMLEDAVEMADSMKGRGYGLEGRTSFTIYRFTKRDLRKLIALFLAAAYIFAGSMLDAVKWHYYPRVGGTGFSWYPVTVYLVYLLLCMAPVMENLTVYHKQISNQYNLKNNYGKRIKNGTD